MKKVDFSVLTMDSKETSANAERCPLFSKETCFTSFAPLRLFSKEATLCHALPCKARNDRETPKAQNVICKKVDRIKTTAKDSRICDEKSGLSSDWQGSYLSGNDRRQSRRIHDLSRKSRIHQRDQIKE